MEVPVYIKYPALRAEERPVEWTWDVEEGNPTVDINNGDRIVTFYRMNSGGTAVVRGNKPMSQGHHFWEMEMVSRLYGTNVMVGIGTPEVEMREEQNKFISLLGKDSDSWGLSYRGRFHHDGEDHLVMDIFNQGCIIGFHLDLWNGTLSIYKDRQYLGVVCRGLQGKTLYPMACSTAACSGIRLIRSCSFPSSLQFLCCAKLRDLIPDDKCVLNELNIPPGLKTFLEKKLDWFLNPRCDEKVSKKQKRRDTPAEFSTSTTPLGSEDVLVRNSNTTGLVNFNNRAFPSRGYLRTPRLSTDSIQDELKRALEDLLSSISSLEPHFRAEHRNGEARGARLARLLPVARQQIQMHENNRYNEEYHLHNQRYNDRSPLDPHNGRSPLTERAHAEAIFPDSQILGQAPRIRSINSLQESNSGPSGAMEGSDDDLMEESRNMSQLADPLVNSTTVPDIEESISGPSKEIADSATDSVQDGLARAQENLRSNGVRVSSLESNFRLIGKMSGSDLSGENVSRLLSPNHLSTRASYEINPCNERSRTFIAGLARDIIQRNRRHPESNSEPSREMAGSNLRAEHRNVSEHVNPNPLHISTVPATDPLEARRARIATRLLPLANLTRVQSTVRHQMQMLENNRYNEEYHLYTQWNNDRSPLDLRNGRSPLSSAFTERAHAEAILPVPKVDFRLLAQTARIVRIHSLQESNSGAMDLRKESRTMSQLADPLVNSTIVPDTEESISGPSNEVADSDQDLKEDESERKRCKYSYNHTHGSSDPDNKSES